MWTTSIRDFSIAGNQRSGHCLTRNRLTIGDIASMITTLGLAGIRRLGDKP